MCVVRIKFVVCSLITLWKICRNNIIPPSWLLLYSFSHTQKSFLLINRHYSYYVNSKYPLASWTKEPHFYLETVIGHQPTPAIWNEMITVSPQLRIKLHSGTTFISQICSEIPTRCITFCFTTWLSHFWHMSAPHFRKRHIPVLKRRNQHFCCFCSLTLPKALIQKQRLIASEALRGSQ